ncbi:MAG: helix-turn-helix transcriptional regulator [Bacteroidota bacterium]
MVKKEAFIFSDFECEEPSRECGFQLMKMEDVFSIKSTTNKNPFKSHRIDFFTLLLLMEGEMTHEVDFVAYKMLAGDGLFVSKEQIHKFDESPGYKGYILIFSEEFLIRHLSLSAFSKISFLSNYHLNPSLFKTFDDISVFMNALKRELSFELGTIRDDIVASMLTVFLLKAQLYTSHALKSYYGDYGQFAKFQNLVAAKYMESRSARYYATRLFLPYKQLNKLSRIFTEMTAKEYINNYIILEAKRSLAATNTPVKEIAYSCGFKEATNFIKFFKRITGDTPMQFRKMRFGSS